MRVRVVTLALAARHARPAAVVLAAAIVAPAVVAGTNKNAL